MRTRGVTSGPASGGEGKLGRQRDWPTPRAVAARAQALCSVTPIVRRIEQRGADGQQARFRMAAIRRCRAALPRPERERETA